MQPAIAYIRVSTKKQGQSGLGLEAQTRAISEYAHANDFRVVETRKDVDTGSNDNRPELRVALAHAKALKCPIIVAKLDRLSRKVHFISGLMEQRVEFICCDIGRQDQPFTLHIFAAVAEQERKRIGERIRGALQAKKARGLPIGNSAGLAKVRYVGTADGCAKARAALAEQRANTAYRTQVLGQGV